MYPSISVCLTNNQIFLSFFRVLVVGSEDKETRVFAVEPCVNLVVHSLGGHSDDIVGAFFEHNSMDVSF